MHPQSSSRIDLGDLKSQIVKKIGPEKAKRYFYNLNRFLNQKLSKNEFDSFCIRTIGKDTVRLHNLLIRSILKNACQANTPPPIPEVGPTKSLKHAANRSPTEDGHEQSGSLFPNQNVPVWSNGGLPVSPRKVRSGIRGKFRDRPSPLGPNGKVENLLHQPRFSEDSGSKNNSLENGVLTPCDYQRPLQHLEAVAEQPENYSEHPTQRLKEKMTIFEDSHLNFSQGPLIAPLGIPASAGRSHKALPLPNTVDFVTNYETGGLYDTETLKKRMEQIAATQGLGGVTIDCANMLNNMLDVYLKRLIKSCVDLVGPRSGHEPRNYPVQNKQQIQGKIINGMWPSNHVPMQSSSGPVELKQGMRSSNTISLLDFKTAMELNPQQLGEDWPVLLEKICMQSFEE
ncbi:hypothetical protein ACFE04_009893 [Oxalis oulophora]